MRTIRPGKVVDRQPWFDFTVPTDMHLVTLTTAKGQVAPFSTTRSRAH